MQQKRQALRPSAGFATCALLGASAPQAVVLFLLPSFISRDEASPLRINHTIAFTSNC